MADKVIDDTNVGRLVSDIKAKADATYWPISDTEEISLATVATSGSYNDLTDKPTAATGALIYVGTCATAAATATKVVTVETFPLQNSLPVKGTTIAVKFTNTNTASTPKLNVNSTGAISIYYNTAVVTSTSATYGGTANRYLYYFYDGTYWVWLGYSLDANDNTVGYNLRTNATRKTVSGACYRYRILFTSADGKQWVPSNTSTSTNATASRTVNQTKIDPWGPIAYYGTTTALSSGGAPAAAYLYEQYSSLTFGYSFNRTGAALTLTTQCPVWIKAAPQTDGSAIIDSDTPYVQSLPSTADGKIYILLGNAIAATTVELLYTHPVYYYKGGKIRQWTGADTYVMPTVEEVTSASATLSATMGTIYQWTVNPSSIAVTLPNSPSDVSQEIRLKFTTGIVAPTLSLPSSVSWENDTPLTMDGDSVYDIHIGYDTLGGWIASGKKFFGGIALPTGYTAYTWIAKTSGTGYIDTGYVPTTKPLLSTEIMRLGNTVDADLFGCNPTITNAYFIVNPAAASTDAATPGVYYKYGSRTSGMVNTNWTKSAWHKIIADENFSIDGTVTSWATSWDFSSNTGSFRIFAGRNQTCVNFAIKRTKIYDGGVLKRDLVPCTNPNSEAGMYDLVTSTFYGTAVSGQTFTVGD